MNHPCVVWPMAVPLPKVTVTVTVTNPYTATAYHTRPCPRRSLHHQLVRRTSGKGICRAGSELTQDAPFAIAIGACFLNSILFPLTAASSEDEDEDEAALIGPTDARFAVMTIMAFIPFFNWLSWVFALMDTGKRRYAVYAAVYLAPYLRTNFSLSPEESWLPIASIVLCIVHIQLEASVRSGDLDAFAFFNEAAERFGLFAGSKDDHSGTQGKVNKGRKLDSMKLPSRQTQWEDHTKPSREAKHVSEDSDLDDGTEH